MHGAFYAPYRPTFAQRVARGLGFSAGPSFPNVEPAPGLAESAISIACTIRMDWRDRLRTLATGVVHVGHSVQTDVPVATARTTTSVRAGAPRWVWKD